MSFPIHRVDLNDVASPKLDISSVTLPESSSFIEKRILTLSKQITKAAADGKKNVTLTIVILTNVEPVSAGLKVNFPDVTFTTNDTNTVSASQGPPRGGPGGRGTQVVVNWE